MRLLLEEEIIPKECSMSTFSAGAAQRLRRSDYEIYFVSGLAGSDTRILRMRHFFKYRKGESFSKNPRFSIENDFFVVRFTTDNTGRTNETQ